MEFSSNDKESDYAGIDLTSMIDVLFVLLLFFMVTTTFSNYNKIPINLPEASSNKAVELKEPQEAAITITEDKQIFIEKKNEKPIAVALNQLQETLKKLKASSPEIKLNLMADKNTNHGTVVEVLDQAKQAGIDSVGISTKVNK